MHVEALDWSLREALQDFRRDAGDKPRQQFD